MYIFIFFANIQANKRQKLHKNNHSTFNYSKKYFYKIFRCTISVVFAYSGNISVAASVGSNADVIESIVIINILLKTTVILLLEHEKM